MGMRTVSENEMIQKRQRSAERVSKTGLFSGHVQAAPSFQAKLNGNKDKASASG
jgi:hypothetical protein